jgi:carboxypeptidase C (cathepsin A)
VYLNLKSIGIGDGWTNPLNQYPGYYEFAVEKKFVSAAEGLVLEGLSDACQALIDVGLTSLAEVECNIYFSSVVSAISATLGYNVNVYDVRIPCDGQLCYNFDAITKLMNMASVQKSLGVAQQVRW